MQVTRDVWDSIPDLMVADTNFLGAAAALKVHLAINNFVPSLDLALGDLTEATFTGSAALTAGAAPYAVYNDVATGYKTIRVKEPAGGWNWICTVAPGAPETVYGVYLTDNASAVLVGAMLLDAPVTISAVDDGVGVGDLLIQFLPSSPF